MSGRDILEKPRRIQIEERKAYELIKTRDKPQETVDQVQLVVDQVEGIITRILGREPEREKGERDVFAPL